MIHCQAEIPLKLGIHLPLELFTPSQTIHAAKLIEKAEFDHVVVNDHFSLPRGSKVEEAWTVIAAIGTVTHSVRIGPSVTPLPLRHPFLLAKMAATVDQLTSGRLLMGVGAGWYRQEFQWLEVPFHRHPERLAQIEEAVHVIQRLWTEKTVSFQGIYYQLNAVSLEPKPVQQPHPPFFFGGGSRGILELMAYYGNGWMPFAPTLQGLQTRINQLWDLLAFNDRSQEDFEVIPNMLFQHGKNAVDARKHLPKWGKSLDDSRVILGSSEDCAERLKAYAEMGATHLTLRLVNPTTVERDLELIQKEILPKL
ncbi:MAG: LLM class flavin-dependent oxidoreductase [Candidatus Hodarchaeota archaeon]